MRCWAALLVLLPCGALAADGDAVATYQSGAYVVNEYKLCDGDHSATDCGELDLNEVSGGLPEFLAVDLVKVTGCGAVTLEVRGLTQPLGLAHTIGTLSVAGTTSIPIDLVRFRYLDGIPAVSVGCTDLEVHVRIFVSRFRP